MRDTNYASFLLKTKLLDKFYITAQKCNLLAKKMFEFNLVFVANMKELGKSENECIKIKFNDVHFSATPPDILLNKT